MPVKRRQGGFTLIELIVVLVIMAVLAAAALPAMTKYIGQAKETTALNEAGVAVRAAKAETVTLAAAGTVGEWKNADKKAEVVSAVDLKGEIRQVEISDGGILTGLYYEAANGILVSYRAQRSPTLQVETEVPPGGDVIGGNTGPAQTVEQMHDKSQEVAPGVIAGFPNLSFDRGTIIKETYKANGNTLLQVEAGLENGTDWKAHNPKRGALYWRPYTVGILKEIKEQGVQPQTLLYAAPGNNDQPAGWQAVLIYWQGQYYQYQSKRGEMGSVTWVNNHRAEDITPELLAQNGFVPYS